MSSRHLSVVCGVAAWCLIWVAPAWTQEKPGPTIGDRVDRALGQIRQEAHSVAGKLREEFERARVAVDNMGVQARIYARLHWDKALVNATVSAEVQKGGIATLRGTVPTAAAKAKAKQLAADTVGVERVVDELKVVSPPPH
jgi:hyperosmotically inducible periplasmic protein